MSHRHHNVTRTIMIGFAGLAVAAAPASAKPKDSKDKPGAYQCVPKNVGFNARGTLVSSDLTQTAGADTTKRGDDRYSGSLTVMVKKANHAGQKGEQTYTVTNARLRVHPRTATPTAGDRVKVSGKITKLTKKCSATEFTPTVTVRKVDVKSAAGKTHKPKA